MEIDLSAADEDLGNISDGIGSDGEIVPQVIMNDMQENQFKNKNLFR